MDKYRAPEISIKIKKIIEQILFGSQYFQNICKYGVISVNKEYKNKFKNFSPQLLS